MRGSIPNPCARLWEDMAGDERRRHCSGCDKDVFAVEQYSDAEWAAITAEGPVCAYSAAAPAARSRRGLLAGLVLTTIAPLFGQDGRLRVRVTDSAGRPLEGVAISVAGPGGISRHATTGAAGTARITGLLAGKYRIVAQLAGFLGPGIECDIANSAEFPVDLRLEIGNVGSFAATVAPARSLHVLVTDAMNAVIPQATVKVDCGDGTERVDLADSYGVAVFQDLPPGECRVTVSRPGFQPWRWTSGTSTGGGQYVAAKLEVGEIVTGVFVEATRPKNPLRRFANWLTSCTRR